MKGTHALALVVGGLWGLVLLMGLSLLAGHSSPSAGQVSYYVICPTAMLGLVIGARILAGKAARLKPLMVTLMALVLLVLPGYLLFYTGGV